MVVLCVDDNEPNRLVIKAMFESAGVTVIEAEDGAICLAQIEERNDIELVLMDLRMPVMDGATAIARIRSRRDAKARLPIILITADGGADLAALAPGADAFMAKPVMIELLFATIGDMVAAGRLQLAA